MNLTVRSNIRFCLLLIWLAIPLTLPAQLLYEISGNGVKAKSYLLATNALVDKAFLDTIPNVFTVFARCDKVVTEFAVEDYEALSALRKAALLPDSAKLEDYFKPSDYLTISNALTPTLKMSMEQLGRMKPAYLTELYRTALMQQFLGLDEARTMSGFFEQVAQQTGIRIIGLDNPGEMLYMTFEREPFEYQCEELLQIVTYPDREVELERNIRSAYLNGRLGDIAFQIASPDNRSTISYSDYTVWSKRNEQWAKRLEPYLKEGKSFLTINCIYLGGEGGLITALRKKGYRVKRVNR